MSIPRVDLPAGVHADTLAVREGLPPSAWGENSEALFLTSSFVHPDAATAAAPVTVALAVTSILFAIVHWGVLTEGSQVGALATQVVLSVGWGMLYERTGRLWAPMIAHAAFNAANLWVALKG